jgi:hypothetical protein
MERMQVCDLLQEGQGGEMRFIELHNAIARPNGASRNFVGSNWECCMNMHCPDCGGGNDTLRVFDLLRLDAMKLRNQGLSTSGRPF